MMSWSIYSYSSWKQNIEIVKLTLDILGIHMFTILSTCKQKRQDLGQTFSFEEGW